MERRSRQSGSSASCAGTRSRAWLAGAYFLWGPVARTLTSTTFAASPASIKCATRSRDKLSCASLTLASAAHAVPPAPQLVRADACTAGSLDFGKRPTADIRPCGSSKTGFRLEPSSNNPTTSPSRPSASPQFAAAAAVALPAEQGRSTLVLGPLPHGPLTPSRVWHTRYALADAVVPSRAAYSQHPAQQLLDLRVVRSTPPQARNESIERTVPIGVQKQLVDLLPQWSG